MKEKYPHLFGEQDENGNFTEPRYGFDCPAGCEHLVELAFGYMTWRQSQVAAPDPFVTVLQVKQKFGGLRIYKNGGDDYIDEMLAFIEYMSSEVILAASQKNREI
jgi:hypothetical protein